MAVSTGVERVRSMGGRQRQRFGRLRRCGSAPIQLEGGPEPASSSSSSSGGGLGKENANLPTAYLPSASRWYFENGMGSNGLVGQTDVWEDDDEWLALRLIAAGSYSRCTFGGGAAVNERPVSSSSWRAVLVKGVCLGERRWSAAEESWWSTERGVNPSRPKAPGVHIWLAPERVSTRCEEDMLPPEEVERVWACWKWRCGAGGPLERRLVGGKCGPEAGAGATGRAGASKKLKSSSVKASSYSMLPFCAGAYVPPVEEVVVSMEPMFMSKSMPMSSRSMFMLML